MITPLLAIRLYHRYRLLVKESIFMSYKKFEIIKEILIRANKDFKSKEALEIAIKLNKLR